LIFSVSTDQLCELGSVEKRYVKDCVNPVADPGRRALTCLRLYDVWFISSKSAPTNLLTMELPDFDLYETDAGKTLKTK